VGSAVRLYHHEAEAFLCASADKFEQQADERGQRGQRGQTHRAYLQVAPPKSGASGGLPQHQQHQNFSTKQLFVIERGDDGEYQQSGGAVMYNGHYRFRHIASGKFLSVTAPSYEGGWGAAGQDEDMDGHIAGVLVADKMQESTLFTIARIGERQEAAAKAARAAAGVHLHSVTAAVAAAAAAAAARALAAAAGPTAPVAAEGRLRILHNQTGRWLSTALQTKKPRTNR
jgi:hypothetical protein